VIELRPYQEKAVKAAIDYIRNNPGKHPVIGMPTGSGKTMVIGALVEKSLKWGIKVVILSHNSEILEQDYTSLSKYLDENAYTGRIGLFSAGLGRKDIGDVTVAGIQSVYKKAHLFSEAKLVIIDEAHTINNKDGSMYSKFFAGMDNPTYLGLTATCYRLGTGYIYGEGRLFDDIPYDLTSMHSFNKLIRDGYLCDLHSKGSEYEMDTSKIRVRAGDFIESEMDHDFVRRELTKQILTEVIEKGKDRKAWLIFAINISHANMIAEILLQHEIRANVVHSKMEGNRRKVIDDFKSGKYRAIVNVNVLTTGFDHSAIDMVVLMRPTKSPVLHVQMIGRGLRISPNKKDCLILDYAGNTKRIGPINNVTPEIKGKGKKGGEPIMKTCPICQELSYPAVRVCPSCKYKFRFKTGLEVASFEDDIILKSKSNWYDVDSVSYHTHKGNNSPDSLLVMYHCGTQYFKRWICVNHSGYAKHVANNWVRFRGEEIPDIEDRINDIDSIIEISKNLKIPNRIEIKKAGKYPEITDEDFN